ncbi:MAG: chromosome condensation regulator [Clostridia bacterium]|nr:chromosome condensation regulator [Clostridia bacterium]
MDNNEILHNENPDVLNEMAEENALPHKPKKKRWLIWTVIVVIVAILAGCAAFFVPKLLKKPSNHKTLATGMDHTVALLDDGTVVATGRNEYGQCNVSDWEDIISIDAAYSYTVGLKSDGTVVVAGFIDGDVSGWTDIVEVYAMPQRLIGLKSDGTVAITNDTYPVYVEPGKTEERKYGLDSWTNIVDIAFHDLGKVVIVGLKEDGTVVAAGENTSGQCDVSGWTDIVSVSTDGSHTLGLKKNGTVVATGNNEDGQCDVADWEDIVSITAGYGMTIGVKKDGTVLIAGDTSYGQYDVDDWENVVAVYGDFLKAYALQSDGTVLTPYPEMKDWTDIVSICVEADRIIGLKKNGTLVCNELIDDSNKYGECDIDEWNGIRIPETKTIR